MERRRVCTTVEAYLAGITVSKGNRKQAQREADAAVARAEAGVQAVHDAMAAVCDAVADTLEGMGLQECMPNPTAQQHLAFKRLVEEIRQRGRV